MTDQVDAEATAAGLSEAGKIAVLAFAPPFAKGSQKGMLREWADICYLAGPRRSIHNTIRPLVIRGLAERDEHGLYCLTIEGLAVRDVLMKEKG